MSAVASPKEFITRALRAYETQEEAKIIVKARESARSKPNQTKSSPRQSDSNRDQAKSNRNQGKSN